MSLNPTYKGYFTSGSGLGSLPYIGFVGGLLLFFQGFRWWRLRRRIEDIPTSKIRSLAMGLVEVKGKVIPTEHLLDSPITNKRCIFYFYLIELRSGESNWMPIKTGYNFSPYFMLKDETGKVLVKTEGASFDVSDGWKKSKEAGNFIPGAEPDARRVLKKVLGGKYYYARPGWIQENIRYTEYVIKEDDEIYLLGTAAENPFIDSSQKNEENIMIQKGSFDSIYYMSKGKESSVGKKLMIRSILCIVSGAFLAIGCLTIILINLGLF